SKVRPRLFAKTKGWSNASSASAAGTAISNSSSDSRPATVTLTWFVDLLQSSEISRPSFFRLASSRQSLAVTSCVCAADMASPGWVGRLGHSISTSLTDGGTLSRHGLPDIGAAPSADTLIFLGGTLTQRPEKQRAALRRLSVKRKRRDLDGRRRSVLMGSRAS